MAETLSTLSIISFIIAGISLAFAVFFWFFFRIPIIIGDLSGSTARKSIAQMRAANEKTGMLSGNHEKAFRSETTGFLNDQTDLEITELLSKEEVTVPLDKQVPPNRKQGRGEKWNVIDEVILIHTDETIK